MTSPKPHTPCAFLRLRASTFHTQNIMDPGKLTNISVIYPDVQHEETGCVSFKPLLLTVCFLGMLPEELLQHCKSVLFCSK
jgi:hypothetical protein